MELQSDVHRQNSYETIDNVKKEIGSECTQLEKTTHVSIYNLPSQSDSKHNCSVCCKMFEDEGELQSHVQKEHFGKETDEPIKEEIDTSDCDIGGEPSNSAVEGNKMLNNRFCCSECPFSTNYKNHLKRHLMTHSGERPFQCEHCGKAFAQSGNLNKHLRVHTGERPYVCDTCGRGFSHISALRRHEVTLNGKCKLSRLEECQPKPDRKFRCTLCPYSANFKGNLNRHLSSHSGERPHQCKLCNKAFAQKGDLKRHLLVHTGERSFVCDTCGKGFVGRSALREHEGMHSKKPHLCNACGKSFDTSSNLATHFCSHNGVPPYVCDQCGKVFGHKSSLRIHKVILKGECHLPRHSRSHQKADQKFRCSECPYSTDYKVSMDRHLFTHFGERPHQCELCNKTFIQREDLKRHLLTHEGERPYVCDICGKGFTLVSSLRRHKVRLHEAKKVSEGSLFTQDNDPMPSNELYEASSKVLIETNT